jgi:predicted Zn finger-like uncharacterized protein
MKNKLEVNPYIRLTCPHCKTSYRIPSERIPSRDDLKGHPLKTQCLKCQRVFTFSKKEEGVITPTERSPEFSQKAKESTKQADKANFFDWIIEGIANLKKLFSWPGFGINPKKFRYLPIGVLLAGLIFYGLYGFSKSIQVSRQLKKLDIPQNPTEFSKVEEGLTAQGYYEKGREYFLLDEDAAYSKAEAYYIKGMTLDVHNPLFIGALAENYSASGQIREDSELLEKAYQLAKKALEADPNLAEGYRVIADLLKYHHQYDESEAKVKKALELKPDYADSHYVLGSLALARGDHYGIAYDHLKKAIDTNPGLVRAYVDLSALLNDLELYEEAANYAYKGLELSPENFRLKINLGLAYKGNGYYDGAIQIYQKILESKPDHLQILNNLGELHNTMSNYDNATWYLNRAIMLNPYEAAAHALLGDSYFGKGDDKTAIQFYQKAISLGPQQAAYHYKLGNTYVKQRKFELAKSTYQRGLELGRNKFIYSLAMGKMYREQKLYRLALESYQRAFSLQPRNKEILEDLVKTYQETNESGQADFYRQILELPRLEKISKALAGGLRCLERKAYSLAIDKFQEALALDENYPQASYYLGRAYEASGNGESALKAYIASVQSLDILSLEARNYLLNYLGTQGSSQGVTLLEDLLKNNSNPDIQSKVVEILRKIAGNGR